MSDRTARSSSPEPTADFGMNCAQRDEKYSKKKPRASRALMNASHFITVLNKGPLTEYCSGVSTHVWFPSEGLRRRML